MANINPTFGTGVLNQPNIVGPLATANILVNSTAVEVGIVFTASVTDTMTGFNVAIGTLNGTPTNGLAASMYATNSAHVQTGAALASNTPQTPTANSMAAVSWTSGYTTTAGAEYVVVITNAAGTPASNNFNIQVGNGANLYLYNILSISRDTGTSWWMGAGQTSISAMFSPVYTTNGEIGAIYSFGAATTSNTVTLYNTSGTTTRRYGIAVKFPQNVYLIGGQMIGAATKVGSPTFNLCLELCSASASIATTPTVVDSVSIAASSPLGFFFDVPQLLTANTQYYVDITPVGATAGTSANAVELEAYHIHSPATIEGPIQGAYYSTASGNPSWIQDATFIPAIGLYLVNAASSGLVPAVGTGPFVRGVAP